MSENETLWHVSISTAARLPAAAADALAAVRRQAGARRLGLVRAGDVVLVDASDWADWFGAPREVAGGGVAEVPPRGPGSGGIGRVF